MKNQVSLLIIIACIFAIFIFVLCLVKPIFAFDVYSEILQNAQKQGMMLQVSPNPCVISQETGMCNVNLRWLTQPLRNVQIYVKVNNGSETLVSCLPSGSVNINWISGGKKYTFLMYESPNCNTNSQKKLIKNIEVIGTSNSKSPIRIMPIGDSITQCSITDSPTTCYRYWLWNRMIREGWDNFDFVGSMNEPNMNGFRYDSDSEGHSGWTSKI